MGDFDRHAAPAKPNETKKLAVVLALGVVLIGLVSWQMMKGGIGPQQAAGAPIASGEALPPPVVPEEISPQALEAMTQDLRNDPTQPLLRQNLRGDHLHDAPPRNPFAMAGAWVKALTRPEAVVGPATPPATRVWIPPEPAPATPATPKPPPVRAEDFKLNSILNGNLAVINGKMVHVGDVVLNARVIEIREDSVTLEQAEFPNGPTTTLSMPRLNQSP